MVVCARRLPGFTYRKRAGRSLIKISFIKLRIRKLSQVWPNVNRSCVYREQRDSIEFMRFPIKMPSRVKRRHNSIKAVILIVVFRYYRCVPRNGFWKCRCGPWIIVSPCKPQHRFVVVIYRLPSFLGRISTSTGDRSSNWRWKYVFNKKSFTFDEMKIRSVSTPVMFLSLSVCMRKEEYKHNKKRKKNYEKCREIWWKEVGFAVLRNTSRTGTRQKFRIGEYKICLPLNSFVRIILLIL